jgi:hypothetical protein
MEKQTKFFISQSKQINKSNPYSVYRDNSIKNPITLETNVIDEIIKFVEKNDLNQYLEN